MALPTIYHSGFYKNVLENLIASLRSIDGEDKNTIIAKTNSCLELSVKKLEEYALKNPLTFPVNLDSVGNWQGMLEVIANKALENEKKKRIIDVIPFGGYFSDSVVGKNFISPLYISGRSVQEESGNVVISYVTDTTDIAIERLDNIVISILLSLPPKKVCLTIVDFGMSGSSGFLTSNLDPGIYHDEVIVDQSDYTNLLKRLSRTMAQRIKNQGSENEVGKMDPLELILLLGDPDLYDYHWNELRPIWENGRKCGVHFIAMKDRNCLPQRNDGGAALAGLSYIELSDSYSHYVINSADVARVTPIAQVKGLAQLCFEYLNNGFREKEKPMKILDQSKIDNNYEDCSNGALIVEIGKREKNTVHFEMDLVSHIHAFILGMSGSGKSVLLHNIIANLICKYSPEQLQLYLMDFKLGGVEFNRYRNTKHVKALLVDNSDNSVVLEILRELNTEMYERGKLLKRANVQRIDEYNRVQPDTPMPQIIAVIDECHNIFNLEGGRQTGVQREVLSILTKITKEGRNQGVHLIMATQTLSGADIPGEILNNISDHYLLKCAQSDSERLAPGSSSTTFGLPIGKVFYHHQSGTEIFQGFYLGDDSLNKKISFANDKSFKRKSNGQFYFSGSQIFKLTNEIADRIYSEKILSLSPGETCSLRHHPVEIMLSNQDAQNILITGIDSQNTTRTTVALIESIIKYNTRADGKYHIDVINCLEHNSYLQRCADERLLILAETREERGELIGKLANDIECNNTRPTVLVVIGQQLFRELKKDFPISVEAERKPENLPDVSDAHISDSDLMLDVPDLTENTEVFDFGFEDVDADFSIRENIDYKPQSNSSVEVKHNKTFNINTSFSKALRTILTGGPEQGIHTILQVDKPGNILFEDYPSKKMIYDMFAHLLIHRSDESTANVLALRDSIRPENLTSDEERLKAIYFNEETDQYTIFSPYIIEYYNRE